jgi:pectinesterase
MVLSLLLLLLLLLVASAGAGCAATVAAAASPSTCCPAGGGRIAVPSVCATIRAAIDCAGAGSRTEIALAAGGTFREQVLVPASAGAVTILGLGTGATIIHSDTGGNESMPCSGNFCKNGTLVVEADDFILSNVRVANAFNDFSAGKNFALNLAGDRMSAFRSSFFGKDDMFYTGDRRIFVAHSTLNGSTDFLFGQGAAVFLNCTILAEPGKFWSFITAANGNCTTAGCGERSSYLLDRCRLPAQPGGRLGTTFLGRPWGPQSSVLYKNCWMDKHISPKGWATYRGQQCSDSGSSCMNTSYAEFNSSGPGATPELLAQRVKWSRQLSAAQAAQWTAQSVLRGWTPPPEPAQE